MAKVNYFSCGTGCCPLTICCGVGTTQWHIIILLNWKGLFMLIIDHRSELSYFTGCFITDLQQMIAQYNVIVVNSLGTKCHVEWVLMVLSVSRYVMVKSEYYLFINSVISVGLFASSVLFNAIYCVWCFLSFFFDFYLNMLIEGVSFSEVSQPHITQTRMPIFFCYFVSIYLLRSSTWKTGSPRHHLWAIS